MISLFIIALSAGAASITIPNVFSSGDPALASEVNANFNAIVTAVNDIDTTPPEITHDAPSSTWDDSVDIEVTITDDNEIAYYIVQDIQHPSNNQTFYLNPGEGLITFNIAKDATAASNSVLVAAADMSGNFSKALIIIVNDAPTEGYIKVGSDGSLLPDTATEWDCIKEVATGLIWEKKSVDGLL